MSRFASVLALLWLASDPLEEVWIVNPKAAELAPDRALARVLPDVHAVEVFPDAVIVRSAGISTHHLGPLQNPPSPIDAVSRYEFRIPRQPRPASYQPFLPQGAIGVFVTGVPVYNQFVSASYQGRNLWHYDLVAQAGVESGSGDLLRNLISDGTRHSPILGYAFDGYPIYGPWAYANADGTGGLRRMRSSYQLRSGLKRRCQWPDGTHLTPGQCGPDAGPQHPLGTFVEDYAYQAGSGDLDDNNGRFAVTPEYPKGTYAYFLTTDAQKRLAFPYLLAHRYHGEVALAEAPPVLQTHGIMRFRTAKPITAGSAARLSFEIGERVRHPEIVHEKPLHVLVISENLARFDHIHPELTPAGRFEMDYTFTHPGRYRIYADFTPPGAPQRIESFAIEVQGEGPGPGESEPARHGLRFTLLEPKQPLRAGEDTTLEFTVRDAATGLAAAGIEPFLGAWAHFVVVNPEHTTFLHAHPLDGVGNGLSAAAEVHIHGVTDAAAMAGPPPASIRTILSFPRAGRYKLWMQVQQQGQPVTEAFWLDVRPPVVSKQRPRQVAIPDGAIRIRVDKDGFHPAELLVTAGKRVVLAIERDPGPNCGNRIVFPSLGREADLAPGTVTLVELPALPTGTVQFGCGMGMYRGAIVAEPAKSN